MTMRTELFFQLQQAGHLVWLAFCFLWSVRGLWLRELQVFLDALWHNGAHPKTLLSETG